MKTFTCCFLLATVLTLSYEKSISTKNNILSISDGLSFGFCRSYCRQSINITSTPNQLVALKEPNYAQDTYPPVKKVFPFPLNQWQELINFIDAEGFQSLADRIGCPDCADGGAEWIEIQWSDGSKRVTFENGALIKGFEGLIVQLRNIRMLELSNGKSTCSKDKILSISDGLSFGFCHSYCRQSINITSTPKQLVALKEPNYAQDAYPPLTQSFTFPSNQWQELIKLIDDEDFQSLADSIGCPDCADGGAEWIEIQWSDESKRVTFENGALIKGFEGLIVQLRNLRIKYTENL
ncbi:unnamed protein product [Rotaria sp. Silwood2]|nr:unnamed protein product [Rotaria sp. Silwood2]